MGQEPGDDVSRSTALVVVEHEVDDLRRRTQELLEELERRVHDGVERARSAVDQVKRVVDVRAHARWIRARASEQPILFGAAGAIAVGGIGLGIFALLQARAKRNHPAARLRRRLGVYRTLLLEPHRALDKRPNILRAVVSALLTAAVSTLAKNLVGRTEQRSPGDAWAV